MNRAKYVLPFRNIPQVRLCTAPFHRNKEIGVHCLDFYMPSNTPIIAARGGIVFETESRYWKTYFGRHVVDECNYVIIRHADGEFTVYAHLAQNSVMVRKNQKVRAREIIALSGQTGTAWYPHLHFGIYDAEGKNIIARFAEKKPPKVSYKKYCKGVR